MRLLHVCLTRPTPSILDNSTPRVIQDCALLDLAKTLEHATCDWAETPVVLGHVQVCSVVLEADSKKSSSKISECLISVITLLTA